MPMYTALHNLRLIHEMPTSVHEVKYPNLGVHEGELRAFNILEMVKEMLRDKCSTDEILLRIELMEKGF